MESTVPDVSEGQLRQVRQLLDLDDGVVERRLQALCHHVGQDHSHHHGQDVRDLACELEADDRRRHRVRDRPRQCCRTCAIKKERSKLTTSLSSRSWAVGTSIFVFHMILNSD